MKGYTMELEAKIDAGCLVIRLPMNPTPVASMSGKTLVVASTHGNKPTSLTVNGKPVIIGVNAYIRK